MTAICIPIFVKANVDLEEAITEAEDALEGTDGMLELRCDTANSKQLAEAMDLARLPVIVTIRPTWEGGHSDKTDDQRIALWEEATELGADYIDIELVSWEKKPKIREAVQEFTDKAGTRIILSNHSFEGRPPDLDNRLARLRAVHQAAILKIAWKADSILDGIDALRIGRDLHKSDGRPVIALAMGEEGLISRLLAKTVDAPLTFAASPGKESAPGQPTVADLLTRYRWEKQSPTSPLFGVIGWPVGHSLSPHIHNAGFDAIGTDGIYVPLAIKFDYETFAATLDTLRTHFHLRGLSITIPHKENAFRYATEHQAAIDPLSQQLAVINTLTWSPEGALSATNSDYAGALDALVSAWSGNRTNVAGKRIAVLGAGGAARAIVAGLAAHGATVVIYNRTREKADALAAEFNAWGGSGGAGGKVVAADWDKLCDSCCQAYINCTPLGMYPRTEGNPITFDPPWTNETVVFDTVYNPLKTRLIKLAERKGAKAVLGLEMFVRQAAIQFERFTNQPAPVEVFREVIRKAFEPKR